MIKECPSYPGYCASDTGEIYSHRRRRRIPNAIGGTVAYIDPGFFKRLSPTRGSKGHQNVRVKRVDGKMYPVGVHRLVADAFIGPCPEGQMVRHLDDNKDNNSPANLAYGTVHDNAEDRVRNGLYARGSKHVNANLTDAQVEEVRLRRERGEKIGGIARTFGVGKSCIEGILSGKTYDRERTVPLIKRERVKKTYPPYNGPKYKGVAYRPDKNATRPFQASAVARYLGMFASAEEAAQRVDEALQEAYGMSAAINFARTEGI